MIAQIYHLLPEKVKLICDVAAGSVGLAALMGHLTTLFGLIASASAAAYGVMRLYYFIKDRRAPE